MPKQIPEVLEPLVSEPTRRNPTQQRSRERQERILAVATQLIAAKGSDQLKMSEIAERSEISIGSLYHCLLYTSPSPRDLSTSRMPSSA